MKKKICIVGPFPPFKGGIPQYNELLARELNKDSEITLISYKRQYPKFLIKNREQIDKTYLPKDKFLSKVHFLTDSINPISWYKTLRFIKKINPDLVIMPWWVIFWSPMYICFCIYLRRKGIKSLMICHNVFEHDDNFIKQFISKISLKLPDLFIVHTESEKKKLELIVDNKPIFKHLIPLFNFVKNTEYVYHMDKKYNLKLLFFGSIREYKGIDLLLDSMIILNNKLIELNIVGDFWNGSENHQKTIDNNKLSNVKIINQYIPDNCIKQHIENCDVVVLPYKSATGSAVIPLAYSYGKPVLATKVGGLVEAVKHTKTGYLVNPCPIQIAKGINWFLNRKTHDFSKDINDFVTKSMSWSGLAKGIYQLNDQV